MVAAKREQEKIAVLQKREVFEQRLRQRSTQVFDRYRENNSRLKAVVREAKKESEDKFGMKVSQNFEENRKIFWKEMRRVHKRVQGEERRGERC